MPPSTALFIDLGMRGPFVCRSCLTSLRKAQRPTGPHWPSPRTITSMPTPPQTAQRSRRRREEVPKPDQAPLSKPVSQFRRPVGDVPTPVEDNEFETSNGVYLRLFEQTADGQLSEVTKYSSATKGMFRGTDPLDDELERELTDLEDKLRETAQLVQRLGKHRSAKQRADVLRNKYGVTPRRLGVDDDDDGGEGTLAYCIATTGLSLTGRRHVRNVDSVVRPVARRLRHGDGTGFLNDKIISRMWTKYGRARTSLAEAWGNVPRCTWEVLWTVLAHEPTETGPAGPVKNTGRMAHVYYLAKDMREAGVPLTDAQQLLVIEAMFVEGWPVEALSNWKRAAATLGARPATATAYWELGVRMSALHGDLDRAERAAERLFGDAAGTEPPNPRVLLQLIRSAATHDEILRATAAYRKMRALLGAAMTLEDYDEVVTCFLGANHTEEAFAVFVDMMFSGTLDVRSHRPGQPVQMPPIVGNQFFFGKWLKRLIGAGDLDGAYHVLRFMESRGIMTATVQVNGLLGAWLRTGTAANVAQADMLAWRMIHSRRLFVDLRRRRQHLPEPVGLYVAKKYNFRQPLPPPESIAYVPRASLETFALMADNYKDRGRSDYLEDLLAAYQDCEMNRGGVADAFILNQLLESYVYNGDAGKARALYERMVTVSASSPSAVQPNTFTFLALFRSLDVHRLISRLTEEQCFDDAVRARKLFAEMAARARLRPADFDAPPPIYQAFVRLVLHAFRKAGDYPALIVAAHTLRPLLGRGLTLSESLAVELLSDVPATGRDTPIVRRRILRAGEVVSSLLRQRQEARVNQGLPAVPEDSHLAEDQNADDFAAVITYYYRLKCQAENEIAFQAICAETARQLHVESLFRLQTME